MKLPAGKLPPDILRKLLARVPAADPAVVVGGSVGEDAAVIDTGGPELLVATADPITFAAEDIGRYLLAVNGNDLATMGAEPRWLLVTALLPEGVTAERAEQLFESVRRACAGAGVALVGGHTEITVGLDRPILSGCLLGTVARDRLIRTAGARAGDAILLAGGIAVEGAAILATEHAGELCDRGADSGALRRAAGWLSEPGISVLPAARLLRSLRTVHAMHDPTEGGILTALHELAEAAGVGVRIDRAAIPVLAECTAICEILGLDPLGLLASGALLATLDVAEAPAAVEQLRANAIPAACIGSVVPATEGRTFIDEDGEALLPVFERDELARFLESR